MSREIDPRDCQHGLADSAQEEIDRLRAELADALAALDVIRVWKKQVLALPALSAASRLRDDIYEECRGIIAEVVNTAWIDFGSNGFWAASQQDAVTGLGRRIDDAIRALKSKEADQ